MTSKIVTKANAFISTFTVDPKHRKKFEELFNTLWTQHIDIMEAETNFVFYGWSRDENVFVAIESWKSEEATNKVRASPVFQKLVGELIACSSAPMTMQVFNGLDFHRGVFDLYPKGTSTRHPGEDKMATVFL